MVVKHTSVGNQFCRTINHFVVSLWWWT